jgi:hypothetical protein
MNARLDDRVAEPDLVVTAMLVVAAALYLALAGWLIAVQVGAGGVRHVPVVTVDNQTHLTLEIDLVDQHGDRMTLGAHQPGRSSRQDVADPGSSWTFEIFYGPQQVDRQTFDRAALARQGWMVHIPAAATADLERAGFQ